MSNIRWSIVVPEGTDRALRFPRSLVRNFTPIHGTDTTFAKGRLNHFLP